VIRALQEATSRITLKEYDLGHKLARESNITSSPTILSRRL